MDAYGKLVDPQTVVFERLLSGPIERVFAYLWDEDLRKTWFTSGAMPTRVGERFSQYWKHSDYSPNASVAPDNMKEVDEKGHHSSMVLLAYEPPTRLAYTFGEMKLGADKATEVEFLLKAQGEQVLLTLTHRKLPDRAYMLGISGGWHAHLDVLEYHLRNQTPPGYWDIWRKYEGVYDKRYA